MLGPSTLPSRTTCFAKPIARAKGGATFDNQADTGSRVQQLFPPGTQPDLHGGHDTCSQELRDQLLEEIHKAFKKFPRRSGPGPSGSRFEHWGVVTVDENALQHASETVLALLLGECPQEALLANLGARLVAIKKASGGLRPIAMGSVLRRLGARAACAVLKKSVAAAVGPHQFGVGRKAGCELVHKLLTALTDEDPTRVVLTFDASNAFNSLPRQRVWEGACARLPELTPILRTLFKQPTTHVFWDSSGIAAPVTAASGVDQGCPLSPLLFALGIASMLECINTGLKDLDPSCRVFAYLDDVIVVAPPHLAKQAHDIVETSMENLGLALNDDKTKAWTRDSGVPLHPSISVKRSPALKVLGGQVSWLDREDLLTPIHGAVDPGPVLQAARGFVQRLSELHKHGLTTHSAFLVLKTYSQSCITHIQRANYEDRPWVQQLDNLFSTALCNLLPNEDGTPASLSPDQLTIAGMTTKAGGLAYGGLATRSAPAFLGSWALCLQSVASELQVASMAGLAAKCPTTASHMQRAEATAAQAGCLGLGAMSWQRLLQEPMPKLQSILCQQIADKHKKTLLGTLDDEEAADLRSHGGPGAGSFMLPRPQDSEAPVIPDKHFKILLRDRLLLPVCPVGATCCHRRPDGRLCGEPLDRRGKHPRKCKIQGLVEKRHDCLRDWGCPTWSREMGLPATTEQRVPQWDRVNPVSGRTEEAKLDIATSEPLTGAPLYFDFVVYTAHSDNQARLRALARTDGKAAADAAAEKRRRYEAAGPSLTPLPLEAGGRPGEDTIHWIRRMADGDSTKCTQLWHELSCTLQLWNAELLLGAIGK